MRRRGDNLPLALGSAAEPKTDISNESSGEPTVPGKKEGGLSRGLSTYQ